MRGRNVQQRSAEMEAWRRRAAQRGTTIHRGAKDDLEPTERGVGPRNTGGGRGTVARAGDNREVGVMRNILEGRIGGGHREVPGENEACKGRCGISAVLIHVHTSTGDDAIAARQPHEVTIV